MELFLVFLFMLPAVVQLYNDPAPGPTGGRTAVRRLDCERTSSQRAARLHPGEVVEEGPRGDYIDRDAVVCRERIMAPGARHPRDEAILGGLESSASTMAATLGGARPDLKDRTLVVQAYYPSDVVTSKISFSVKNALVAHGFAVTDRVPTLAPADIDVIGHTPPAQAYPMACRRMHAHGSLKQGDALVGIVLRDSRETILHLGVCVDGSWQWLR